MMFAAQVVPLLNQIAHFTKSKLAATLNHGHSFQNDDVHRKLGEKNLSRFSFCFFLSLKLELMCKMQSDKSEGKNYISTDYYISVHVMLPAHRLTYANKCQLCFKFL